MHSKHREVLGRFPDKDYQQAEFNIKIQMASPENRSVHILSSTNPLKYQKQKPFSVAIDLSSSLQATRVIKHKLYNSTLIQKSDQQSPESRSIIHDLKLDESRILSTSNSQTLSTKKKPLDLSNSSKTSVKGSRTTKEHLGENVYRQNLLKWHRRINTYKQKDFHVSQTNQKQEEEDISRRYSFRTVKNENNKLQILIEPPFKEQFPAKQLKGAYKPMHLNISNFVSKYNQHSPSSCRKQKIQKCEVRNDEADQNLKEFLKSKLGIGNEAKGSSGAY